MEVIQVVQGMQERCEALRLARKTIALVPTMGFLHRGHLELMKVGRRHSDVLIISIFVNPTQFGAGEDFEDYPRDLEGDLKKAEEAGVDLIFNPSAKEMYPPGFQTGVSVTEVTRHLCGVSRPGHFAGVTTVVAKLFNITRPHIAIFGQKDYQQLTAISRMVKDLSMGVQIVGVPTVREADGLAMSSRNSYLSAEERASALCLNKALNLAEDMIRSGERRPHRIKSALTQLIEAHPFTEIDYISLCHPVTLEEVGTVAGETLTALSVKVGKAKLIDNRLVEAGDTADQSASPDSGPAPGSL